MTPQEKAKELVDKFYNVDVYSADYNGSCGVDAKQCALICIKEKIDELQNISDAGIGIPNTYLVARMIYLKTVEQEIKKYDTSK